MLHFSVMFLVCSPYCSRRLWSSVWSYRWCI